MNKNSYICNYIKNNPDAWQDDMVNKFDIKMKTIEPYTIFNYSISPDFSNPIVQEARGIIINTDTLEVVCWPFRKFGKYYEDYSDKIDWKTAKVQEKLDGSIIKLWYNNLNDEWVYSTNSMIFAKDSYISMEKNISFMNLIESASNYKNIGYDKLDKDSTYIFELTSPDKQIVITYDETKLYHIGTRNNKTGQEFNINIGIDKPRYYDLHSLDDCISVVTNSLNKYNDKIKSCNTEGFVVVDANYNRVKIKSPIYVILHNIIRDSNKSRLLLLELLYKNEIDVSSLSIQFPKLATALKYYDYRMTELLNGIDIFIERVRYIYKSSGYNRKEIALIIKNHPWASIGFKSLDNDLTSKELLLEFDKRGIAYTLDKFIPNYDKINIYISNN